MNFSKQQFCLRVWGSLASFNRPEFKVERVSYEVITPSAARAIFSAIFWKPAILWHIVRIEVLQPIRMISIRKNEAATLAFPGKKPVYIEDVHQQKSGLCLRDVAYRIHAEMEYLPPEKRKQDHPVANSGPETPEKYVAMFTRRAAKGQSFFQPYLGTRECAADFEYIPQEAVECDQKERPAIAADRDFGIMLYDMDFDSGDEPTAMFYRAVMNRGVIEVPAIDSGAVLR